MTKPYAVNGLAGCVEQRKNRLTGTTIGLYNCLQAFLDPAGGPWAAICETHSAICNAHSLSMARSLMTYPDWCSECSETLAAATKR